MDTQIAQERASKHQIVPSQAPHTASHTALPVEPIDGIMHFVGLDSRPTLLGLSLLYRTFKEPSQRLLFVYIDLGSHKARRGPGPHLKTSECLGN
jgi:hypothetical protein